MRWIGLLIVLGLMAGLTAGGYSASVEGWGLPGLLKQPVSIREQSATTRRTGAGGAGLLYLGRQRRHSGGGFHGGK